MIEKNNALEKVFISPYFTLLSCFLSGLVLNSEILSSTAQPDLADNLDPPVKIVLSVLNVSTVIYKLKQSFRI